MKISVSELRFLIREELKNWKDASVKTPCEYCGAPSSPHPDYAGNPCLSCVARLEHEESVIKQDRADYVDSLPPSVSATYRPLGGYRRRR